MTKLFLFDNNIGNLVLYFKSAFSSIPLALNGNYLFSLTNVCMNTDIFALCSKYIFVSTSQKRAYFNSFAAGAPIFLSLIFFSMPKNLMTNAVICNNFCSTSDFVDSLMYEIYLFSFFPIVYGFLGRTVI